MSQKNNIKIIDLFLQVDLKLQQSILKGASDNFIDFLGEIALNVLKGVLPLSSYYKKKLNDHAPFIRDIASAGVKRDKRRKLCVKYTSILTLLLKAVYINLKKKFKK